MRLLLILAGVVVPAMAQTPSVLVSNTTRNASKDFQVGDRYEVVVTGAPSQSVSVRTMTQSRVDWSPEIGRTDASGRWTAAGQFEKTDFGRWDTVWTVGGKMAGPEISFSVGAPAACAAPFVFVSGPNVVQNCQTAAGKETYTTASQGDPFRTLDGRVAPRRNQSKMPAEEYRTGILEYRILNGGPEMGSGALGDEAGSLIGKLIGVNALTKRETLNVLAVIRAAFDNTAAIPQALKAPSQSLLLLQHLQDTAEEESLKSEILATMEYLRSR